MKILAVDTALGACSVALLRGEEVLAHIFEPMDRGHAERLAPMVDEAMKAAKTDFAALDRLAVTVGPGTFTGQRVGLAFMRGLRLALKRPLTGVTTLEAIAAAAMAETAKLMHTDREFVYKVLGKYLRITDRKVLESAYNAEIKVLEPRLVIKTEALQAILDELAQTDPRAKKVKPQELIDTRYLDEMEKTGFFDQLWGKKS